MGVWQLAIGCVLSLGSASCASSSAERARPSYSAGQRSAIHAGKRAPLRDKVACTDHTLPEELAEVGSQRDLDRALKYPMDRATRLRIANQRRRARQPIGVGPVKTKP